MAWVRSKATMFITASALSGTDPLIPTHVVVDESISQPFRFDITAVSQTGVIDVDTLLATPLCVTLQDANGPIRYFHGIVQQARQSGLLRGASTVGEFNLYSITVVPKLWFLNQTEDCRVYENKSAQDIISALFQDAGLTDLQFSVTTPASRPYTVQYNETDYNFALRLMEQEGWYYYFQHTDSKHTIVITDKNATFQDVPNATLHFAVNANDQGGILDWKTPARTVSGSYALGDYDPVNPGTKLYNMQKTVLQVGGAASRDVYHWPALTNTQSIVEARAKFEMEAAEASASIFTGASHFGALVPGGKFTLKNNPANNYDGSFVLRSVQHVIVDESWISNDGEVSYRNAFEAFLASRTWRQPMVTPHPRMDGVYSALVMGPQSSAGSAIKMQDGEEIYTDDLARVKVRFYWDWRAEATGGGSVWARVIQPWAGNGWGAQFLPRVGTEVAVAFVDGDVERPIVVGGLYNGVSSPIYAKTDATKSGFRTRSSLKGDTSKFNELTFDDKKGSELIFVHAEKDLTTEVEHDESLTVDNCRVVLVKADETITVKGKQTITITKDHTFEVTEGNYASTIDKGTSAVKISTGDSTFEVSKGNHSETIGMGNHSLKVSMGNMATEVSMGNYDLKVSLGNITVKAAVGSIDIEALQGITLKVGPNSLKIDPSGVTINGLMVTVKGTAMTTVQAPMTQVKGDAMVMIKGAITMIN